MPKAPTISLTKLIEGNKVHPRTGLPLGVPPATIPYGALVEPVGIERDRQRFTYLGELYECPVDLFVSATGGRKGAEEEAPAVGPAPAAAEEAAPKTPEPAGPRLEWTRAASNYFTVMRTAVPGGWLVTLGSSGLAFVPDAKHRWNGGSVK